MGRADYRVGSCYHCLISVPVPSLLAWILLFVSIIGWATSTWLGLNQGRELLNWVQSDDYLTYEEIALIAISLATVLIAVVYLIIATFSSPKMSRYTFASSKKNIFGYCLSVTVIVLCFLCVLFWTLIIALTMVPVAALAIIHILVGTDQTDCLHLPSYGVGTLNSVISNTTNSSYLTSRLMNVTTESMNVTTDLASSSIETTTMPYFYLLVGSIVNGTTTSLVNGTTEPQINNTQLLNSTIPDLNSVGMVDNTNATVTAGQQVATLTCGNELEAWMVDAWRGLVPLLISIAFAVAIECAMLGFLTAASSNARHLRERMEYINEPYNYNSAENVNGNVKATSKDTTPGNNNQSDTQI